MPEQLGDAALVFDPDSVDQIADCIRRLWNDDHLCTRITAEAKERVSAWGQCEFNARLHQIVAEITVTPSASEAAV
jgi:hypothetical protein